MCGRRRERFPDKTVYNYLCDIEWNTPVGQAKATGGDFMCRAEALVAVNGFNSQVVAGEEPELSFRWRQQGWQIQRLDEEMTLHDVAMTSWQQWWKRYVRSGHAYAQGFAMHGGSKEHYNRREVLRILVWSLIIPAVIVLLSLLISPWLLLLMAVYPLKVLQLTIRYRQRFPAGVAYAYSLSLIAGKFPQLVGIASFYKKQWLKQNFEIIEYKQASSSAKLK